MRRLVILVALLTALALPAQALASGVTPSAAGAHQYVRTVPTVITPTTPTLPFTGEDVLLVVLVGGLLTGGGLTLYRQVKQR